MFCTVLCKDFFVRKCMCLGLRHQKALFPEKSMNFLNNTTFKCEFTDIIQHTNQIKWGNLVDSVENSNVEIVLALVL